MNQSFCPATFALVIAAQASPAWAATVGWPDTIDLLTQEQSQAQACVDLLKSAGDQPTLTQERIAYNAAKAASDGVIAGFTTGLVEGYKPESLQRIQANLDKAGAGLKEVCDSAIKAATRRKGNGAWSMRP
jgi:hypothetical protein